MSVGQLVLAYRREGGAVVVQVIGELDVSSAAQLAWALTDLIDDQGCLSVVLDLSDTTFIDSSGVRLIVEAMSRLAAKRGSLIIREVGPGVRRAFDLLGLGTLIETHDQGRRFRG